MFTIQNTIEFKGLFCIVLVFLILERIENTFSIRSQKDSIKVYHKKYFFLLLAVYLSIVVIANYQYFQAESLNGGIAVFGFFIYFFGLLIRRLAIKELKSNWSVYVEIKRDQKIIKTGIYKYLKHPYYVAVLLELSGFSLFCNSFLGYMITSLVQLPLLLIRIHYEDKILKVHGKRLGILT